MKILFVLILCTFWKSHRAQEFTVTKATSQGWAGGVCCRTGVNYHINFSTSDTVAKFDLDTLWIGERFFLLDKKQNNPATITLKNGKKIISISVGTSCDERNDYLIEKKIEEKKPKAPKYAGVACVIYRDKKNAVKHFVVEKFEALMFLAYP